MIEVACAFTGHRPKSFPWGYDENAPSCVLLKEVLASQISALAEQGMAQGVGLWYAQIVLDLRKKNPALKLHAILPCEGQERKWTASAQEHYRSILAQANEVIYVGQEYSRNCMLKRNRCLVDHSSILLAVLQWNLPKRNRDDGALCPTAKARNYHHRPYCVRYIEMTPNRLKRSPVYATI